jgi:DNA-binding transcriptional regulator/RsmH inhibitor MraZ
MRAEIDDKNRILIITHERDEFGESYEKEILLTFDALVKFSDQLSSCIEDIRKLENDA